MYSISKHLQLILLPPSRKNIKHVGKKRDYCFKFSGYFSGNVIILQFLFAKDNLTCLKEVKYRANTDTMESLGTQDSQSPADWPLAYNQYLSKHDSTAIQTMKKSLRLNNLVKTMSTDQCHEI